MRYDDEHGAMLIEYDANSLVFKFINISNEVIDCHTLSANNNCNITTLNASTSCKDNGTEDPLDDVFNIALDPSGSNLGSQYTVEVDNVVVGTYNYGTETTLLDDYLITSGNISVQIQDNVTGSCSLTEVVSPPQPCSDPTDCGGSGNTLTFCDGNIEMSVSGNEVILVTNNYPSSDFLKIKIRTPSWEWVVTLCTSTSCTPGVNLTIPQNIVDQYGDTFVADIQGACTGSFDFIVGGNNGGGAVDNDNDGVCSDVDCDDNDPNIPTAPGTLCDDGDPNTTNDVIQADGCTCQGEEPQDCKVPIPNDCTPNLVCVTLTDNVLTVNTNGTSFPKIDIHGFDYSYVEGICDSWSWTPDIPICEGTLTSSQLPPGSYLLKVPDVNGTCWIPFTITAFSENSGDLGGSGGLGSLEDSGESKVLLADKNDIHNYETRVFPNPTQGIISVSNQLELNHVIIYSLQGEKLLDQHQDFNRIDINSLMNGIYLMIINTNNGIITKKVIKI